jgi:hypothetical protein
MTGVRTGRPRAVETAKDILPNTAKTTRHLVRLRGTDIEIQQWRDTMTRTIRIASALIALGTIAVYPGQARAEGSAELDCKLKFSLSTWSVIYKHSEGSGVVTCENGKSMNVNIVAKGAGLTVGKSHVDAGTGRFSDIHRISDVLGDYAQAEAHAGVVKSGTAQVLTKGTVSLALAGDGEGVDLGIDVGKFTLTHAR